MDTEVLMRGIRPVSGDHSRCGQGVSDVINLKDIY